MINFPSHRSLFLVDPRGNDAYGGAYWKAVVKHGRATVNQVQKIKPELGP